LHRERSTGQGSAAVLGMTGLGGASQESAAVLVGYLASSLSGYRLD
jgi:putative protein kinase ArgK-like GTPase of G3E family